MPFSTKFSIQSDTRYLSCIRQWLAASFRSAKVNAPKGAVMECTLALIEAVDNAIFHAHKRCVVKKIDIGIEVSKNSVLLEVADGGHGIGNSSENQFRPDGVSSHGRGLFLIESVMSKVKHEIINDRHKISMTYKL